MTVHIGIFLALLCALATNLGFLYKHRGACAAPDVDWLHPIRSGAALFRSRWFAVGMLVATGAWGLHVAAMAMAPLSLVQAVISGGLVFLTVLAERVFGFSVGRRQWLGVGLTALGLVLLAVTLPGTTGSHSTYSTAAMIGFEAGLLIVGTLLVMSHKFGARHEHPGVLLGMASGVLFGVSDVAIKYLTHSHGPLFGLVSPWTLTAVVSFVISFYASARSLQIGDAVEVIAITSVAANLAAILGGILVFGEPIGSGTLGITARLLAFSLVIAGAALVPAPLRARSGPALVSE
jgi:drug/metabolite transporter (DMT)-like permease